MLKAIMTEDGTKSKTTTTGKETAPKNWPFPTYKGVPITVDNSRKTLLAFIKDQPEAVF